MIYIEPFIVSGISGVIEWSTRGELFFAKWTSRNNNRTIIVEGPTQKVVRLTLATTIQKLFLEGDKSDRVGDIIG